MTGDRPTTPGWHCHRCRSTSCRQRADSDTDHVGRVEYRPLLLTQPSSVSWLWSHTHWCPSQRPQEVMRVDGSANPTMPKNPAQYVSLDRTRNHPHHHWLAAVRALLHQLRAWPASTQVPARNRSMRLDSRETHDTRGLSPHRGLGGSRPPRVEAGVR